MRTLNSNTLRLSAAKYIGRDVYLKPCFAYFQQRKTRLFTDKIFVDPLVC